jgi:hypothetical protein
MIVKGIVRKFGELISEAEKQIIEGIEEERIETETSITDRFLEAIEDVFRRHGEHKGISFKARTLRDRGRGAAEKEFGADFCGVLDINLEGFEQKKGFLSQAKREGYGATTRKTRYGVTAVHFDQNEEFKRLKGQINDMLSITPDSFVFVYSQGGFLVVPASSVEGLKTGAEVYAKRVDRFFKEYLMCFIGDHKLKAWDDNSLRSLQEKTNSRTAIMFQIQKTESNVIFS